MIYEALPHHVIPQVRHLSIAHLPVIIHHSYDLPVMEYPLLHFCFHCHGECFMLFFSLVNLILKQFLKVYNSLVLVLILLQKTSPGVTC